MFNKGKTFVTLLLIVVMIFTFNVVGIGQEAEEYPSKTITLVDPWGPGGTSDIMARVMAPYLSDELGIPVVIENRPGAGGQIGTIHLIENGADGHIVLTPSEPTIASAIALNDAPFSWDDLTWVTMLHHDPICLNVRKDAPLNDFAEFVEYVKDNPGTFSLGVASGSGPHVFCEYLKNEWDLDIIVVPYQGGSPARAAFLGGHVDGAFCQTASSLSIADESKCIGVGWSERSTLWPEAPTFQEAFPDETEMLEMAEMLASYRGFMVASEFKEKHPEHFQKLLEAIRNAYNSPEIMKEFDKVGQTSILWFSGPEKANDISAKLFEVMTKYAYIAK